MKQFYKNCREDVTELCEILKEGTELTVQESCCGIITQNGKSYAVRKVWIGTVETYFTENLFKKLIEHNAISKI